jgi:hypothetical protein
MIWLWAVIIITPYIVSRVKPGERRFLYVGRIFLAIFVGYVLLNVFLHWEHYWKNLAFDLCQRKFSDGAINRHEECGWPADSGLDIIFYLFLGWTLSAGYTAFWEILWQIIHKEKIKKLGKNFKGKIISRIIIIFSIPVLLWFLLLIGFGFYVLVASLV